MKNRSLRSLPVPKGKLLVLAKDGDLYSVNKKKLFNELTNKPERIKLEGKLGETESVAKYFKKGNQIKIKWK